MQTCFLMLQMLNGHCSYLGTPLCLYILTPRLRKFCKRLTGTSEVLYKGCFKLWKGFLNMHLSYPTMPEPHKWSSCSYKELHSRFMEPSSRRSIESTEPPKASTAADSGRSEPEQMSKKMRGPCQAASSA